MPNNQSSSKSTFLSTSAQIMPPHQLNYHPEIPHSISRLRQCYQKQTSNKTDKAINLQTELLSAILTTEDPQKNHLRYNKLIHISLKKQL